MLRPRTPKIGLPLAHSMRVILRILVIAIVMASATASAQPVAEPPPPPPAPTVAGPSLETRDTLLMKQVGDDPTWWDMVTSVASGLMTIAILVLAAALVPAAWSFRKNHQAVRKMIDKFQNDVGPIVHHAGAIADDVHYVTTSIRADVQQVNQTVAAANRRLLAAVEKAEERINDFNALLEVAQEEAESAFVSTASTLRGIRSGAAAFAGGDGRQRRHRDRELRKRMAELRAAIDEDMEEAADDVEPVTDDSYAEEE